MAIFSDMQVVALKMARLDEPALREPSADYCVLIIRNALLVNLNKLDAKSKVDASAFTEFLKKGLL